jgi:Flp pilus assembly protein TadG
MKNRKHLRGSSLIEFALIFPIVFFLITGFIDLGRAVFYYSSLTNAVREATRYAIVNAVDLSEAYNYPSDNALQDKVLEYAFGLTNVPNPLTKSDVSVSVSQVNHMFIDVSILVNYYYQPVTPGIKAILGASDGINLTASSKMLVSPGAQYLKE